MAAGSLTLKMKNYGHLAAPIGILGMIFLILVPLPPVLLDLFFTLNIIMAITILLMTTYIKDPVDFPIYPSLLLPATLFRLALNISATRLILARGEEGIFAAGRVIGSFGQLAVSGSSLIGIAVFIMIIVLQQIVVSSGAGCAAEIAARVTRDKMPGKNISIDTPAGRNRVEKEAEFFATMDGAIQFTGKEAEVTIIFTLVNIIGGILVGVFQKGMGFADAFKTYTILTIGAGLMAALPSLLITVSYLSYRVKKNKDIEIAAEPGEEKKKERVLPPEKIETLLNVDLLGLEIGYSLLPLVDANQDGTLLQRIKAMRRQLALDLGIIVPPVRTRENLQLGSNEYALLLKGITISKDEVMINSFLAINPGNVKEKLKGQETRDPAFGLPAYWVSEEEREHAQFLGYTIVDPATVITTHLAEVIKTHAHELLGRQETQHLVDNLATTYPKIVEELIPHLMPLGNVQKVLRNLLRERVSIIDLRTILETLADYAPAVKDLSLLTELVRQALSRSLVKPYVTAGNDLPVLVLGGELENLLAAKVQRINEVEQLIIDPEEAQFLIDQIKSTIEKSGIKVQPILLCSTLVRRHLRQLAERFLPDLVLLSASEVPKNIKIISLGVVE